MKALKLFLILILLSTPAFAADIYIDPSGANGDGTFATPYDGWDRVTFSNANDYFQKCGTTDNTAKILMPDIVATSGNHMVVGAYYNDGGAVTSQDGGFSMTTCGARPIIQETGGGNTDNIIGLGDCTYVDFEYLDVREGLSCFVAGSNDDLSYTTWTNCLIFEGSTKWGIRTLGGLVDHVTISGCVFDSKLATYGQPTGDGDMQDCIKFYEAGTDCDIKNCTFHDCSHNGIYIDGGGGTVSNNKIRNNYFYATTSIHMRAFATGGVSTGNEVYNNWMDQLLSPSKLMGTNNVAHHNLFSNFTETAGSQDDNGGALDVGGLEGNTSGNKIYNNTFYNIAGAGIKIPDWAASPYGTVSDLEITNNLFIEVGTDFNVTNPERPYDYSIFIDNYDARFSNFTISNNVFFTTNRAADGIYYRGAGECTVAEMEAQAASEGDTSANNVASSVNNNMTDPANDDFTLKIGADCIDAGLTLNQLYDDGWNAASAMPPTAITTSDQDDHGTWDIGVYIRSQPAPTITDTTTTPITCPYGQDPLDVTISFTTDANAYGRISTTNQTWDQMTNAKAVDNGNGTQSLSHVITAQACGQTIDVYVAASTEAGDNGAESATTHIQVVIGSEESPLPGTGIAIHSDGSGTIAATIYNDGSGAIGIALH